MGNTIRRAFASVGGFIEKPSRRQFVSHYQPLFDSQTLKLRGFELLARVRQRDNGKLVFPDTFLPELEAYEKVQLAFAMLSHACRFRNQVSERYGGEVANALTYSVNIEPEILCHHWDFSAYLSQTLSTYGVLRRNIKLEILESAMPPELVTIAIINLQKLRAAGHPIVLDDWPTGESGPMRLSNLNGVINGVKIDRTFFSYSADRRTETLIPLSGMPLTMEGIETADHMRDASKQCALVQGFGLAKPMPPEEALDFVNVNPAVIWAKIFGPDTHSNTYGLEPVAA
jgi:cyclic di-GMP phosphodiesterase Gmr